MMQKTILSRKTLAFFAILAIAIALRVLLFGGLQGSDDLQYATDAYQLLTKGFNAVPDDVTKTRLLSYAPAALSFYLFGVNEASSVLYILLCSVGLVLLVYRIGLLLFDDKTALIATALYAFFPIDVIYATMLYPEIPMSLLMGWAMYLILTLFKSPVGAIREPPRLILAGVLVACAYLTKITALMILGVILLCLLYKRKPLHLVYIGGGFLAVLVTEALFYYFQNGDFLYQYHLPQQIAQNAVTLVKEGELASSQRNVGLYRMFIYYPAIALTNIFTFSLYYHGVLAAMAYFLWKRDQSTDLLIAWFVILALGLNFGIQSLSPVIFIPSSPRYLIILHIPLVLLLAYWLAQARTRRWQIVAALFALVLTVTSLGVLKANDEHGPAKSGHNSREIYRFLQDTDKVTYVDFRTKNDLDFLGGYNHTLRMVEFGTDSASDLQAASDSYVVVNRHWINRSKLWASIRVPPQIVTPPAAWQLVKSIQNPFRELNVGIIASLKNAVGIDSSAATQTLEMEQDNNAYIYYVPAKAQ